MPEKYDDVINKAKFLVKLAMPTAFRIVKKEAMMSALGSALNSNISNKMSLLRNHSTGGSSPQGLHKSNTMVRRGSSTTNDENVKGVKSGLQRRKTVLLNDSSVNKKDSEVDWRDRIKQWK